MSDTPRVDEIVAESCARAAADDHSSVAVSMGNLAWYADSLFTLASALERELAKANAALSDGANGVKQETHNLACRTIGELAAERDELLSELEDWRIATKCETHLDAHNKLESLKAELQRRELYDSQHSMDVLVPLDEYERMERVVSYAELLRQVVFDVVKWNEAYKEPLLGPIALIDRARAALAKNPGLSSFKCCGASDPPCPGFEASCQNPANYVHETSTEPLASWMRANGFTTGHGDDVASLLRELTWQIEELRHQSCTKSDGHFCECQEKCGDAPGWEDRACRQPHGLLRPSSSVHQVGRHLIAGEPNPELYPNLHAVLSGCVSGNLSDWIGMASELRRLLAALDTSRHAANHSPATEGKES